MFDYRAAVDRRIEQFRYYLELMSQRRTGLTKGSCFIIFEEQPPEGFSKPEELIESKPLVRELAPNLPNWGDESGSSAMDETVVNDLPDAGWRSDDSQVRFIQFSFNPRYFDMDIPNTTLFRAEADQILRRRVGFFYVKDRRQFEHPAEDVQTFNPLRKVYIYGDERSAAEDMAYIWFSVWKFPVDWRFYVKAAAFCEKTDWEYGVPIE